MSKNEKVKKPNIIGGDRSYCPDKEEGITMSKIKMLDGKEYELKSLSSLDLKKIDKMKNENDGKKGKGISDYDMTFTLFLFAFKKFNPGMKDMNLDKFMDIFPLVDMENKSNEIMKITGLDFKKGVGKK
jgi:hypothetical protein